MVFNLEKYLIENNLTLITKIREVDDFEAQEPTKSDLKAAEKNYKLFDKKRKEYEDLQNKVKEILTQHAERDASGQLKLKDVAAYKKAIGDLPNKLKLLKKQIDDIQQPKLDAEDSVD